MLTQQEVDRLNAVLEEIEEISDHIVSVRKRKSYEDKRKMSPAERQEKENIEAQERDLMKKKDILIEERRYLVKKRGYESGYGPSKEWYPEPGYGPSW